MCVKGDCGKAKMGGSHVSPKKGQGFPKPRSMRGNTPKFNGGMGGFGTPRVGRVSFGRRGN